MQNCMIIKPMMPGSNLKQPNSSYAEYKKRNDPVVLTAIGRANVDAKAGDFNYAIEKLTMAAAKDEKNTETLIAIR